MSIARSDLIACEYCLKAVRRDKLQDHLDQDCEKVDRIREATGDHSSIKASTGAVKHREDTLEKKLRAQQQAFEQKLQQQLKVTEQQLKAQQKALNEIRNEQGQLKRDQDRAIANRQVAVDRQLAQKDEAIQSQRRAVERKVWWWLVGVVVFLLAVIVGVYIHHTKQFNTLEEQKEGLKEDIKKLRQSLESVKEDLGGQIQKQSTQISTIEVQIDVLKDSIQNTSQTLESSIAQIRKQIDSKSLITQLNIEKVNNALLLEIEATQNRSDNGSLHQRVQIMQLHTQVYKERYTIKAPFDMQKKSVNTTVIISNEPYWELELKVWNDTYTNDRLTVNITLNFSMKLPKRLGLGIALQLLNQHRDQDHHTRKLALHAYDKITPCCIYSRRDIWFFNLPNKEKLSQYLTEKSLVLRVSDITMYDRGYAEVDQQDNDPEHNITFYGIHEMLEWRGKISSPPMYTHPGGYKIKLQIEVLDTSVLMFVYLLKGENDANLSFKQRLSMTLKQLAYHSGQEHSKTVECFIKQSGNAIDICEFLSIKQGTYITSNSAQIRVSNITFHEKIGYSELQEHSDRPPYVITFYEAQEAIEWYRYEMDSPFMYTHPGGYKFQLSAKMSSYGILAWMSLVKGDNDAKLTFEDTFNVTLKIQNPRSNQEHITETRRCEMKPKESTEKVSTWSFYINFMDGKIDKYTTNNSIQIQVLKIEFEET